MTLDFATPARAAAFVQSLRRMLAACTTPAGRRRLGEARTVASVASSSGSLVEDSRHEVGPGAAPAVWDETVVRVGARVGMLVRQRAARSASTWSTNSANAGADVASRSRVASGLRSALSR